MCLAGLHILLQSSHRIFYRCQSTAHFSFQFLMCEDYQKYVVISRCTYQVHVNVHEWITHQHYAQFKCREDLVYDKNTGSLIGYTDLGEVNNHLLAFERRFDDPVESAKSMLTFMAKRLFTNLKFLYVQFASTKLTGDSLFQLFWEVVILFERIGLNVCNQVAEMSYMIKASFRCLVQHLIEQQTAEG